MPAALLVALVATLVSFAALWPLGRSLIRTGDLAGFAAIGSTTALAAFALWTTYGALVGSAALVATNTVCVSASTLAVSARLLFSPST